MRDFKPHVVTTYDEKGGYPHPDHIRCHEVSVAAFQAAGDPARFPDAGEPWQPQKLYYHHGWSYARIKAIHDVLIEHDLESPYAERLENWERDEEWEKRLTTRVPCGDYFGVRDQALLAHATQIDPDGAVVLDPARAPGARLADRGLRAGRPATSRPRLPRTTCSPGSAVADAGHT